jgi:hypothetical protein
MVRPPGPRANPAPIFPAVEADSNFDSRLLAAGGYDSRAGNERFGPTGKSLCPVPRKLFVSHPISEPTLAMKNHIWRALIEVGFIIFLFYSNLLMGEFERSGMGTDRGMGWAVRDILTTANFEIALVAALIGYVLFEFLRKKF